MRGAFVSCACVLLSGCGEAAAPASSCTDLKLDRSVAVLETDYTSYALGRIDGGCLSELSADIGLGDTSNLIDGGAKKFVANQSEGFLFEIDPQALKVDEKIVAHAPGQMSSDPFDADLDAKGDTWIADWGDGVTSVGVVDAADNWSAVDLSMFQDKEQSLHLDAVRVFEGEAFVTMEFIARDANDPNYHSTAPGAIAVVDVAKRAVAPTPITLDGADPYGPMRAVVDDESGARFTLCTAGDPKQQKLDASSGINEVDLSEKTAKLLVSQTELQGFAEDAIEVSEAEGYAIVAKAQDPQPIRVVSFDPSSGKVTGTVAPEVADYANGYAGLVVDGDYLLVGLRDPDAPSILVFDRKSGAQVTAIPTTQYPPSALMAL